MLALAAVVFWLAWLPQGRELVTRIDRIFHDAILRHSGGLPERGDLVLLGVDEASLTLDGLDPAVVSADPALAMMKANFPWDRRVWARAIDRLAGAGARAIVLDFVFSSPTHPDADGELAAAIARHRDKVVLVSTFSSTGQGSGVTLSEPFDPFLGEEYDTRVGYAEFPVDPLDGMCRVARYSTTLGLQDGAPKPGEPVFRSLAAEIIGLMGGEVPEGDHALWFGSRAAGGGQEVYAPLSFHTIFDEAVWLANYDGGRFFKGKVVMIGPVAPRFQDIKATPVGPVTGPQLHLQAAACGLEGAFLRPAGDPPALLLGGGVIAALLVLGLRRAGLALALLFLTGGGWVVVAAVVMNWHGIMLPVTGWCAGVLSVGAVGQGWRWMAERRERQRLAGEFRRFVSRDVADRLVADPVLWRTIAAGRQRTVVILFSDVRDFTSRSETGDARRLVAQLNEYLTAMVSVVFRNHGTLDKFIGDAIMAHWGALEDGRPEEFARAAVRTAMGMREELERLNGEWIRRGLEPMEIGVGIHLGEVTAGEIGCPERTEFGILGDAVNLASRLEGLCRIFAAGIVVSRDVACHWTDLPWISLGRVGVKGRRAPVDLLALGDEAGIRRALDGIPCDENGSRKIGEK